MTSSERGRFGPSQDQHGSPAQIPSACRQLFATGNGICSLDNAHVVQAEHPRAAAMCRASRPSAVRIVRPRTADVRGQRRETCLLEDSALLSICLPPLPEAQPARCARVKLALRVRGDDLRVAW